MDLIVRLIAGMFVWSVVSIGLLIVQPRLNIGNWEAFLFPTITSLLGLLLIWGVQTAFVLRLLILAGFCAAIGYFHLAAIKYFYVQQSDFIHERNWSEYYQAFIFVGILTFIIAAVVLAVGQVFASRGRL